MSRNAFFIDQHIGLLSLLMLASLCILGAVIAVPHPAHAQFVSSTECEADSSLHSDSSYSGFFLIDPECVPSQWSGAQYEINADEPNEQVSFTIRMHLEPADLESFTLDYETYVSQEVSHGPPSVKKTRVSGEIGVVTSSGYEQVGVFSKEPGEDGIYPNGFTIYFDGRNGYVGDSTDVQQVVLTGIATAGVSSDGRALPAGLHFYGGSGTGDPLVNPPTVRLTADGADTSTTVDDGDNVTLAWTTTNDPTNCDASDGVGGSLWSGSKSTSGGSNSVGPLLSTGSPYTFTITCSNSAGSDFDSVTVDVTSPVPPVTATLEADSPSDSLGFQPDAVTIQQGEAATLRWESSDAAICSGSPSGFDTGSATSGTTPVSPTSNTTYTVTCSNSISAASDNVDVMVNTNPSISVLRIDDNWNNFDDTATTWAAFDDPNGVQHTANPATESLSEGSHTFYVEDKPGYTEGVVTCQLPGHGEACPSTLTTSDLNVLSCNGTYCSYTHSVGSDSFELPDGTTLEVAYIPVPELDFWGERTTTSGLFPSMLFGFIPEVTAAGSITIEEGDSVNLMWDVSNAEWCDASWTSESMPSEDGQHSEGPHTFTTPGAHDFSMTCGQGPSSDPYAEATDSFTVYVNGSTVNGSCGSNDGGTFSSLSSGDPDNCSAGDEEDFSSTASGWEWTCAGVNGGSDASCSATEDTGGGTSGGLTCEARGPDGDTDMAEIGDEIEWVVINPDPAKTYVWHDEGNNSDIEGETGATVPVTYSTVGTKEASVEIASESANCETDIKITVTPDFEEF